MPWLLPTIISILISAIFPIMAFDAVKLLPPFLSLFVTFFFASIILLCVVIWKKKTHELKNPVAWKYGIYVGLLNSVAFYGFYYFGLLHTSPGNAALIAQIEVLIAFLLFQSWHKEALSRSHILWILCILAWAVYLLLPKTVWWSIGDILVWIGVMFAPLGNHFAKLARKEVSATSVLLIRYITALPFLLFLTLLFEKWINIDKVSDTFWSLIMMAALVFVLKNICWIEAIRHVTVTRILSIHGFAPFLTIIFMWILRDTIPTIPQIVSGIPMVLGVYLLTRE